MKKNNTILWVLGWFFIFPVPLTILMIRNQKLDKKVKIGIIAAVWIVYLGIAFIAGSGKDEPEDLPAAVESFEDVTDDVSRELPPFDITEDAETEKETETDTEDLTEETTEAAAEARTEAMTEVATEALTSAPVGAETEEATEAPTEAITEAPISAQMRLDVTCVRQNDDVHIGDEWSYDYQLNGAPAPSTATLTSGETLTVLATITESDDKPDVGKSSADRTLTREDIENGFDVGLTVEVKENAGRNSGKTALFAVTYSFRPEA